MKKLIILLSILTTQVFSQISLEQTYSNKEIRICNFSQGGYKYYSDNFSGLTIYNADHSVYKNISRPLAPSMDHYLVNGMYFENISDNLFNNDNLIEFSCIWAKMENFGGNSVYDFVFNVYDENGNIIFSNSYTQTIFTTAVARLTSQIMYVGSNTFKLALICNSGGSGGSTHFTDIYSLPGTLPCDGCFGISGIVRSENVSDVQSLSPYPNPSNHMITIPYSLTKEDGISELNVVDVKGSPVASYLIDSNFNTINISTSAYTSGTYFYSIKTKTGITEAKKIVVTH